MVFFIFWDGIYCFCCGEIVEFPYLIKALSVFGSVLQISIPVLRLMISSFAVLGFLGDFSSIEDSRVFSFWVF